MRNQAWLAVLIFLTIPLSLLTACARQIWTPDNVNSYVSQEVPDGSDRKQVLSFLDRRNIEHADSQDEVVAVFANKAATPSHPDIKVTFHFGSDGKLASKQTETVSRR
jgi:hypothetical protein